MQDTAHLGNSTRPLNLVDFASLNQFSSLIGRKLPSANLVSAVFVLACILTRLRWLWALQGNRAITT